jgi:rhomboid protease GluP
MLGRIDPPHAIHPPETSPPDVRRVPPLTTALLLVNGAFFLAMTLSGGTEVPAILTLFGAKVGGLIDEGQYWRVLSSAYLHIGPVHLLVNGYALYLLGRFVERAYGPRRTLILYTAAALGGGILSTLASPVLSAGASGAIFGLLGVTLLFALRNWSKLPPEVRRQRFLVVWFLLLPFFAASIAFSTASDMVDNWAHLGGLLGGVLVALLFGNPAQHRPVSRAADRVATAGAVAAGALTLASLGFAIHSAAAEGVWLDAPLRTIADEAFDVQLQIPAPWERLELPTETRELYRDRLGSALTVQVRPYLSTPSAMEKVAEVELRGLALARPKTALVRGPETVLLPAGRATHVVIEDADDGLEIQRDIYFVSGRGRGAVLDFRVHTGVAPLYEEIFRRIARSLVLRDGSPLVEALVLIEKEDLRGAVRRLEPVKSGPQHLLALRTLARTYHRLGDDARALHAAREALRLAADDPRTWLGYIEALHLTRRAAEAGLALERARQVFSKDVRTLTALAELAIEMGRAREAVSLYDEILTLRLDYGAFNNLAWLLATSADRSVRNPEKAVRMAMSAVEGHQWKDPTFIDTLAEAFFAAGRPKEAVATAEKALALSQGNEYLKKQLERFKQAARASALPTDGGIRRD